MGACHIAGNGDNLKGKEELQECFIEADQRAVTFYNCGEHIVMNQFFCGSLKEAKGVKEAAVQSFLSLGVSELQVEQTAEGFHNGHAREFPLGIAIGKGAEVAPIDLTLMPRWGFKANEGLSFSGSAPEKGVKSTLGPCCVLL